MKQSDILIQLQNAVTPQEKARGKLHEVFELSFDCKPCYDNKFIEQLIYMHHNPCSGKWNLADEFVDYTHSSAKFYQKGVQGIYPVNDYRLIDG